MAEWAERKRELERKYPEFLMAGTGPIFGQTLDQMVEAILNRVNAKVSTSNNLPLNPFLTITLLEAAFIRVNLALQTRNRSQQLERDAFQEVSDLELRIAQNNSLKSAWLEDGSEDPLEGRLLRNQFKLIARDGEITGAYEPGAESEERKFWQKKFTAQKDLVGALEASINDQIGQLKLAFGAQNYAEQFAQAKRIFEIDTEQAYLLALALHSSLNNLFQINTESENEGMSKFKLPEVTEKFYIDSLYMWLRALSDELETYEASCRNSIIVVPFHRYSEPSSSQTQQNYEDNGRSKMLFSSKSYFDANIKTDVKFMITGKLLEEYSIDVNKGVRLQGVDLWFTDVAGTVAPTAWVLNTAYSGKLKPPEQKGMRAPWNAPNAIWYPSIRSLSDMGSGTDIHQSDSFKNINPVGEWTLKMEPFSVRQEDLSLISNLFIRLKLRHR